MRFLVVLVLVASGLLSSSLEVYRDGAIYTFKPNSDFVGFVGKSAKAMCGVEERAFLYKEACPLHERLCEVKSSIDTLEKKASDARNISDVLSRIVDGVNPSKVDSKKWLEDSKRVGLRLSRLARESNEYLSEAKRKKELLASMSTSYLPAYIDSQCSEELTLRMPGGWISFDVEYTADISKMGKIGIMQKMLVKNRSGIDISAESALFTYEAMRKYINPIRFQPWVVRETRALPRAAQIRYKGLKKEGVELSMAAPPEISAEVKSPRKYLVKNLDLPTTGNYIYAPLKSWEQSATFEKRVYPWRDARVYDVISFEPKYAIDVDRWRVKKGKEIVSQSVTGAYIEGKYRIFADIDEDISVHRERLILKERVSFFGGTVKERDGFKIELFNQSDERVELIIVERIPVAKREDVKVKLLEVASKLPMRYGVGEQGRVEMRVTIPPHGGGNVKLLFEISHDKDKPVVY